MSNLNGTGCDINVDIGNVDHLFKNNNADDVLNTLKSLQLKNVNNLIFAHLNINSLSGKFDALSYIIQDNIDILVVSETKLDPTFPACQFKIPGYSMPFRRDRNRNGGGVMIFVREDISSKLLVRHNLPDDIEVIFVEINLRKTKFLLRRVIIHLVNRINIFLIILIVQWTYTE